MKFSLPKGSLCQIQFEDDTLALSEHGRGEFNIQKNELKTEFRTASGRLRKYTLGFKHQFSLSWTMLPGEDTNTVDGKVGRNRLVEAINGNLGVAVFSYKTHLNTPDEYSETFNVMVSGYQEVLTKRWNDDQFWQITLELIEQ